ncbi:MAG: hypothetical protein WAX04_12685 [Oscillospiraceae bacterium]
MNHHEDKKKPRTHKHNPLHHIIIRCGLPILILVSIPFIAKWNVGLASIISIIVPVMMVGMLLTMLGGKKTENYCSNKESNPVTEE